jgi:hypothetical protein
MSAANAPTVIKLADLVATLQVEIMAFRAQQSTVPVASPTAPVVFAITP